jgi:type VI secretion system protein ImpJ
MTDGRDLPDAIQWHEGMLLAPQHFQQADLRHEGLLHYHVGLASPFHWGVRRIQIDSRALASGVLHVTEIEAVLPDGVLVKDPLRIDLNPFVEELGGRGTLVVHLAVPARRGPTEPIAGSVARYESDEGYPVADENLGEGAIQVPRLRPAARLLVADAPAEKYTSFPLAKVNVQQENYSFGDFVPPSLVVNAVGYPAVAASDLASNIREKAKFLSDKVRASAAMAQSPKVQALQITVQKLFVGLPHLEALLAVQGVHPFEIYLSLCSLAGSLSGLTPGLVPPGFDSYDHNDLRGTFDPIIRFCQRMVDSVEQAYEVVPFRFEEDAFRLQLRPEWRGRSLVVGAMGAPGASETSVLSWVMESRIGTADKITSIEERRIRGAPRIRIDADDDFGLVPSGGVLLFRVEAEPEFIGAEGILTISHPAERQGRERPVEIVLFAPRQDRV